MINYDQYCKIKQLANQEGLSAQQIASSMGIDPKTVRKWLVSERFIQRKSAVKDGILSPYHGLIVSKLEKHPYTARQIYQILTSDTDYKGGYNTVKRYVRRVRPQKPKAYLSLSFLPGECAQVDWGSFGSVAVGNTTRRLSFFVMVLCYSRYLYLEFCVSQTMEHFLNCHANAFAFFGGIPEKIMVDNLKSAVLKRAIYQAPVFNPKYLDFAGHYGFSIRPCNVRAGNEKGRVENAVGYVKKNFLQGLEIHDFSELSAAARQWVDTIANVRTHGVTKERPWDRFHNKEKAALQSLPANSFDIATITQVRANSQFRIILDTNRYSVPARYASAQLVMKTYPDRICIYDDNNLIARHARSFERNRDFEHPDHPQQLLLQMKKAKGQYLLKQFFRISHSAAAYYQELTNRRMNAMVHVRKIISLAEIYGNDAVARAIDDACEFMAFSSEYIANILEQRERVSEPKGALHLTRNEDLLDLTLDEPDLSLYDGDTDETKN